MSNLITDLRSRRESAWHQAKSILETAEREKRDLTAVEESSWQKANADLDGLDQRIKSIEDADRRSADNAAAFGRLQAEVPTNRALSTEDADVDAAFRNAILNRQYAPIEIPATSMRSGWQPGVERRDLVTTSGSGLVGTTFHNRLISHMVDSSAILAAGATFLQTATGETYKVPKSTAFSTAAIVAEAGTITESDPTLGSATLGAYKYGFIVQVSSEMAQDANFDLLGYLAKEAGTAIGNGFGAHAITGTGSSQPRGITIDTTLGVTGGTAVAGAFTADNLIDLYHSVAEPYARSGSAAWIMRNASLGAVRKLKDSQNRYLFDTNAPLGSGASGTLLGRPVYADPNVAATAINAKSVIFGDLSAYWVRQAGSLRWERSDDFAFSSDLVSFRALARLDGTLVDTTGAVRHFVGGAS
jgi:HK97 family phage major capsid protein